VKFRTREDPNDIGPIEGAYMAMAREAGIHVPEFRVIPAPKRPGFFGHRHVNLMGWQKAFAWGMVAG
jgi:hypothetical protein